MAKVVLPLEVTKAFALSKYEHQVQGDNLRALLKNLDSLYPGVKERLENGFAVAIDGQIFQDWFLQEVNPDSEIQFIPALEGG